VILRAAAALAAALAATLVAGVVAGSLPGAPAAVAAQTDLPIHKTDPTGDVNVFDGGGTKPTTGQRRSIDLEQFGVTREGQLIRFTFTIARIVAGRTFDQVVEAQFVPAGRPLAELVVLANPQHKTATTYSGNTACLLKVHTSRRSGTVRVDVPAGCVPTGDGVLRVSAYLQEKNGSGPGFSEDTLRVRGRVSLR
jgi:hypothetical protein